MVKEILYPCRTYLRIHFIILNKRYLPACQAKNILSFSEKDFILMREYSASSGVY